MLVLDLTIIQSCQEQREGIILNLKIYMEERKQKSSWDVFFLYVSRLEALLFGKSMQYRVQKKCNHPILHLISSEKTKSRPSPKPWELNLVQTEILWANCLS